MLVRRILGVLKMTRKRYPKLVRYLFGQAVWYQGSLSILGTITIYLSSQLKLSGLSISVIFLTVMVFVVLGAWLQGFFAKKYGSKGERVERKRKLKLTVVLRDYLLTRRSCDARSLAAHMFVLLLDSVHHNTCPSCLSRHPLHSNHSLLRSDRIPHELDLERLKSLF